MKRKARRLHGLWDLSDLLRNDRVGHLERGREVHLRAQVACGVHDFLERGDPGLGGGIDLRVLGGGIPGDRDALSRAPGKRHPPDALRGWVFCRCRYLGQNPGSGLLGAAVVVGAKLRSRVGLVKKILSLQHLKIKFTT